MVARPDTRIDASLAEFEGPQVPHSGKSGENVCPRNRTIRYRAFGKRITLSGGIPARLDPGFQNRTLDAGLNLYDYRNRTFDPSTGRFIQRDPVVGGDELYNPYVFPGNNPVGNVDPMGLGEPAAEAAERVAPKEVVDELRRILRRSLTPEEREHLRLIHKALTDPAKPKEPTAEEVKESIQKHGARTREFHEPTTGPFGGLLGKFRGAFRRGQREFERKPEAVPPGGGIPLDVQLVDPSVALAQQQNLGRKLESALKGLTSAQLEQLGSGLIKGLDDAKELQIIFSKIKLNGVKSLTPGEKKTLAAFIVVAAGVVLHGALDASAEAGSPPINRQKQDGHIAGTAQHRNRLKQNTPTSTFLPSEDADGLTREAWARGEPVPGRQNVREHDFGRPIGRGPNGGSQTKVRVHRSPKTGEIHGHPSGPESARQD